jgi:hypothetical protein
MFSVGEKKTSTANKFISGQPTCIFSIMYHKFEKKKKELLVWAGLYLSYLFWGHYHYTV